MLFHKYNNNYKENKDKKSQDSNFFKHQVFLHILYMLTYGYVNVNNSYSISKIDIFIFYWLIYYNNLYMFFIIFIQNNSLNEYRIIFLAILILLTFIFPQLKIMLYRNLSPTFELFLHENYSWIKLLGQSPWLF